MYSECSFPVPAAPSRRAFPRPSPVANKVEHPQHDRAEITEDDLRASIRELNEFVDVREEDLVELYQRAMEHARARKTQARVAA